MHQLPGVTALSRGPHADGQERPPSTGVRPWAARSCVGAPVLGPQAGVFGVPPPSRLSRHGRSSPWGWHVLPGYIPSFPSLRGPHPCCASGFSSSHPNSQTEPPQKYPQVQLLPTVATGHGSLKCLSGLQVGRSKPHSPMLPPFSF